jgi:uncharacterized protein with PQ loop repeat
MMVIQYILLNEFFKIQENPLKKDQPLSEMSKKTKSFMMLFVSFFTVYVFFFIYYNGPFMIETTGSISAVIEAFVPIPQWWSNKKRASVESVSFTMIFLWALGDSIKFIYYIMRNQPLQFIVCSVVQIFFDFSILKQFVDYRTNEVEVEVEKIVQELNQDREKTEDFKI